MADLQLEPGPLSDLGFLRGLDRMGQEMSEAAELESKRGRSIVEASLGGVLSLTAGFLSWALRAGSMLASLLSVVPLWKRLDPFPVLAAVKKRRRKKGAAREADTAEDQKVERIFDDR